MSVADFDSNGVSTTIIMIKGGPGVLHGYDLGVADGAGGNDTTVYFYDSLAPVFGIDMPVFRTMLKTNVGKTFDTEQGILFSVGITAIAVCAISGADRVEGFVQYQ